MDIPPVLRRSDGFSRLGVVVLLTIVTVGALALLPLFLDAGNYSPLDVRTILTAAGRGAANRVQSRLAQARRVFGEDEKNFLERVDLSSAPAALTGSRLPAGRPGMGPSAVGNSLLLADVEPLAPLADLQDGGGARTSVPANTWVFVYFYLAPAPPGPAVAGLQARDLWEWRGTPLADFRGLAAMADVTLRNNAIAALAARGISHAFDAAAPAPASAFYALSASPPWIAPDPAYRIPQGGAALLTKTRVGDGAFLSSVCPNTGGGFTPRYAVPALAAADGEFPSGFETAISAERRVSARLVLVAWGKFKGYGSCEQTLSVAVRDARGD